MKRVQLKEMHLVNFRGHKNLKVSFSDETTISGDNRLGKSTVFDAFIWLLFGKDQFDRKDHEIIPIIDNKRADRIDPEVTVVIEFENREMSLKRVMHQKWVRKRGTAEEVFDGCDTLYYINDVPLRAGEYKARVDLIVEESLFKLITNPSAFLSLHWTKQREFLFQIAGTISDNEIAATDPRFAQLLEMLKGEKLAEFKKSLSARKKKLKEDLENIQPRIDQTSRLMPEAADYSAIEAELATIDEQMKAIDLQLSDRAAAIRGQYEEIQGKQKQINFLKTKQQDVVNSATSKAQQDAFEANQKLAQGKNGIKSLELNASNADQHRDQTSKTLENYKDNNKKLNEDIVKLREDWTAENEREYIAKAGCLTCPVFGSECGDQRAIGKHEEAQEAAKTAFFEAKQIKLDEIDKKGKLLHIDIIYTQDKIAEFEIKLTEATNAVIEAEKQLTDAKAMFVEFEEVKPVHVIASELPEWQELNQRIKDIEATITEVNSADNSDLTAKKQGLNARRDSLKSQLSSKSLIEQYKAEIKRLESEGAQLSQQISDLEKIEFTIEDFNRVKIEEADKRVNRLFEIVKFQLFDKTIEGNEFESCIALNKAGVPISATNTAEKINAGLDIIRTLSRFYNVSAPIFCDGAESNNNYLSTESQMVFLRVTKEQELTISNN